MILPQQSAVISQRDFNHTGRSCSGLLIYVSKSRMTKKLRSFDTSQIMTFCHIFEVASRVRQKVVDHRSLTIGKCSVQEKKVVGDKRSLVTGSLVTGSTVHQNLTSTDKACPTRSPLTMKD